MFLIAISPTLHLQVNVFNFTIKMLTQEDQFKAALVKTKFDYMIEHAVDDKINIGDFVLFLSKQDIPFAMTFAPPLNVDDETLGIIYATQFLPFYEKCVRRGIIKA